MTHQRSYSNKLCLVATLIFAICLVQSTQSKTTEEWKNMSIYQLLTDRFARTDGSTDDCPDYLIQMKYCGGTWVGIKNNLKYIKDMGFDAIWISPIPVNYQGTSPFFFVFFFFTTKNFQYFLFNFSNWIFRRISRILADKYL